ncbi:MAG: ribonuclease H-like domain-containing protein [Lachnospiraceae bacterium]|nr:ribonuclease H-like domain-containing protein [Lachnospiraceae bacterium]
MKVFTDCHKDIRPGYPLERFAPLNDILFIDIETTGLSKEHTSLYLVGCGYFDDEGYNTIQWFADTPGEEALILSESVSYIDGHFGTLIHYNGKRFDIPYLSYKASLYGIKDPFSSLCDHDIYRMIKPFGKLMGLSSMRQRSIEQLLDIVSDDPYTGRELIGVYHEYVHTGDPSLVAPLIYHNSEDLKGMAYILPILHYTALKYIRLDYVSHSIHDYTDYAGNRKQEILAVYSHDTDIPKPITARYDDVILKINNDKTALIRIPVINTELKHFYADYRNYYYLPAEDKCIHRSAASGVDPSRRENAKKETCYIKHSGLFIPAVTDSDILFRSEYSSKRSYIPFNEDMITGTLKDIGDKIISQTF